MEPHSFLVETRLCVPQLRTAAVERPELLARFDATRKLTLLVAPAGFGKTTTVLQWLKQQEAPIAWLSLEESDIALPHFLLYLIAAIQKLDPDFGVQTTFLFQELEERHIHPLITPLINDFQRWQGPMFVVLDDIHHLQDPAIHQALSFLLQHLPDQIHMILMSREMPSFSLARLRARGELQLLHTHDLRFSLPQSQAFFRETMGLTLTSERAKLLYQRTEGWATGLQLTGLCIQCQPAPGSPQAAFGAESHSVGSGLAASSESASTSAFTGSEQYIDDFLMTEVFAHQPEEIQQFLLRTSVLSRLTASLCDHLLEREDSASVLATLESRQLFIARFDAEGQMQWYRYHGLFRDWLQHRLELATPGDSARLHQRAALWNEAQSHLSEAVRHWLAARCFAQAATFLEARAATFFRERAFALFTQWIEALPEVTLQEHPQLIAHRVLLLFHQRSQASNHIRMKQALQTLAPHVEALQGAEKRALTTPKERLLAASLRLGHAIALRLRGDLQGCAEAAAQTLDLFPPSYGMLTSHASLMMHTARLRSHGIEANRVSELKESIDICRQEGDLYGWMVSTSLLHYVFMLQGALNEAMRCHREADEILATQWPHAVEARIATQAHIGVGEIHYLRNQLAQAEHTLAQTLLVARQRANTRIIYSARVALAFVFHAQDKPEEAASLLSGLTAPSAHAPGHIQWSYARSLQLSLALGDHTPLLAWHQQRQPQPDDLITFDNHIEYLLMVRWLLAQGQLEQAQPFLDALHTACRAQGLSAALLETTLLEALLRQEQGALSDACEHLLTALKMAQPEGNIRIFLDVGAPMATLLTKCQRLLSKKALLPHASWLRVLLKGFSLPTPIDELREATPSPIDSGSYSELNSATEFIAAGAEPPSTVAQDLYFLDPLSARESEIIALISEGLTNLELAQRLHIALSTIKKHARNIYSKLGVRNRTEAVKRARHLGVIS